LTRLPFQALKLDGALIAGLPDNNEDLATLGAIVAMAKSLDLRLIAAGVETAAQAEVLVGQGCDAAQGRHFAEPCAMKDLF
jgi:EAL domain-containing protein (putative c-di-GMP-specific phosphodiesterase class I)